MLLFRSYCGLSPASMQGKVVCARVSVCACVRVLNKHMGGILKRAQTQYTLSQSGPSIHKQRTQEAVKASAREREREKLLY